MLGYYAQFTALSNLTGQKQSGHTLLLGGLGTHGYEPKVNTLFGFPRSISPGGVIFDIPIAMINLTDGMDQDNNRQYQQQIGQLSSALEHGVPEQFYSTENDPADAISTIKALTKANAEGQHIYQLTRQNMAETLPNLNFDSETEADIEQALRAGLEVTAHTDPVSIPGWGGAGYTVLNPITGSGAYLISGGQSGGLLIATAALGTALLVGGVFILATSVVVSTLLIGLIALIVGGISIGISLDQVLIQGGSWEDFLQGVGGGLALIGLVGLIAAFPIVGIISTLSAIVGIASAFVFVLQQVFKFSSNQALELNNQNRKMYKAL